VAASSFTEVRMTTSVGTRARVPGWWWPVAALVLFVALYSLRYVIAGE
jgi:hypothetical protein